MAGGGKACPRSVEAELVSVARTGDAAAFGELYKLYLGDVRAFCARRISDPTRAEDLAQETFLRAFARMPRFRDGAAFWPWLSTIAKNLCIDDLRHRRRGLAEYSAETPERVERLTACADSTSDEVVDGQTREGIRIALATAMRRVSPRERRLMWQRAVDEMTWDEIARADHSTVDAARNATWRARGVLRAALRQSLRDLRTWTALPALVLARRWRALRSRLQSRLGAEWASASEMLVQGGTACALGLAIVAGSFLSGIAGDIVHAAGRGDVPIAAAAHLPAGHAATRTIASSINSAVGSSSDTTGALNTVIETESRDGGAAPSHSKVHVDVRAPNGDVLVFYDGSVDCGDGQTSPFLPGDGPITAYC